MRCAYVGIASRFGLETLHAEERHTTKFLQRRVERMRDRQAVCFWAILAPAFAEQVMLELELGNRVQAMLLLQSVAEEIGRILPDAVEPVFAKLE